MTVWRIREKIIGTVPCCWDEYASCAQWYANMHEQFLKTSNDLGLGLVFLCLLWNRAGHYIFALWFLSFYLFFPRLISAATDWISTILLTANAGPKKVAKNRHLGTIAQHSRAISSQLRHVSTIGKKNLLSSNISSTCTHNMVNFGPLAAEIVLLVWRTPVISTGFASWQRYSTAL